MAIFCANMVHYESFFLSPKKFFIKVNKNEVEVHLTHVSFSSPPSFAWHDRGAGAKCPNYIRFVYK